MDYERMGDPIAPPAVFRERLMSSPARAGLVLLVSPALRISGYHWIAGVRSWWTASSARP
jgi:hypothetical protein